MAASRPCRVQFGVSRPVKFLQRDYVIQCGAIGGHRRAACVVRTYQHRGATFPARLINPEAAGVPHRRRLGVVTHLLSPDHVAQAPSRWLDADRFHPDG